MPNSQPEIETRYEREKRTIAETVFADAFEIMTGYVHTNAQLKGFWDNPPRPAELIALMHSELSEALEAYCVDAPDAHLLTRKGLEVELADVIIRIMDFSAAFELHVGDALIEKVRFNRTRPRLHGGKKI